jgi:small-conductance mechanosensitive channel
MTKKSVLIILCWIGIWAGFCGWAEGQGPQPVPSALEKAAGGLTAKSSAVVNIYNRSIVVLRAPSLFGLSPQERARGVEERINMVIETGTIGKVGSRQTSEGVLILIGEKAVFLISPGDLDPSTEEKMEQVVDRVIKNLTLALDEAREAQTIEALLRAAGQTVLATVIFLLFVWGFLRAYRWFWSKLEALERRRIGKIHVEGFILLEIEQVLFISRFLVRLATWPLALFAAYLWVTFSLRRFPYTRPWGEGLGSFLLLTLKTMGLAIVEALPGIFVIVVIFFITRFAVNLVKASFTPVEKGQVKTAWLDPDTAAPTRRLLVVFIWLFALVMMYPYIPGSSSDAFKGIGLFVGLVASLGSTALVGQAASGLVLIYSRAFRAGDYVRIGDTEGTVLSLGMLSTKIRTPKKEEVTIPNAGLIGATIKNFSRQAGAEGVILHTTVTIGYSSPWRQVHEMLLVAADRTPGLKKEPKPFVLQTSLSDFYVEYQLNAHLEKPEMRLPTLAALHANIQDAFNEHGVQIMSPHYESDPSEKVWVPKEKWFEPPAKVTEQPPGSRKGEGG